MSTRSSRPPSFDADPFATEFLDDPYPHYERLREAGAMVYLPRYQCHAVGRHAEVERVLGEWETFSSAAGVGLANFNKEKPWRPPSLVLEADPPLHTRTRTVLTRVLSPGNIRKLGERFEREASMLIDRVVDMRSFDGVRDLAEPYPVKVFPDAVGLRHDGREHLLPYGNMVFNSFGPRNALTEAAFANAEGVRAWIMANCARDALAADGLGAEIYAAVDRGELSAEEAPTLVSLRRRRYHGECVRQCALVFRSISGSMGQASREPIGRSWRLRGSAPLRSPCASLLPHDDARGRSRRGADRRR